MAEQAPTPGPWEAKPAEDTYFHDANVLRPDGLAIAAAFQNGDISPQEALANARLIAAAPELLSAARRALNVLKAQGEAVLPKNALGALDAAIAKAEGRS